MIKLPSVKVGGLSLKEMVKIAKNINPEFWKEYGPYDNEKTYEIQPKDKWLLIMSKIGFYTLGVFMDFFREMIYHFDLENSYWFSYDYYVKQGNLQIYLSNNGSGCLWDDRLGIRIMKDNITLGFSGRLRKSKAKELVELASYVSECCKKNISKFKNEN